MLCNSHFAILTLECYNTLKALNEVVRISASSRGHLVVLNLLLFVCFLSIGYVVPIYESPKCCAILTLLCNSDFGVL